MVSNNSYELPKDGINVYERIVTPKTTLVSEEGGKNLQSMAH